jgi:hypothetical protein
MPTSEELHAKERRKYPTIRLRARVICSHDILTLLCLDRPVSEQAVGSSRDECRSAHGFAETSQHYDIRKEEIKDCLWELLYFLNKT